MGKEVHVYVHQTQIRVRYGETDQMGYLYYGNYAEYYEVGRTEATRALGTTYKDLEAGGIGMPVLELWSQYIRPAHYDELLTVKVIVKELPTVKMTFHYEISNEEGELINIGRTVLVFFDSERRRPCKPPEALLVALKPYLEPDHA